MEKSGTQLGAMDRKYLGTTGLLVGVDHDHHEILLPTATARPTIMAVKGITDAEILGRTALIPGNQKVRKRHQRWIRHTLRKPANSINMELFSLHWVGV